MVRFASPRVGLPADHELGMQIAPIVIHRPILHHFMCLKWCKSDSTLSALDFAGAVSISSACPQLGVVIRLLGETWNTPAVHLGVG